MNKRHTYSIRLDWTGNQGSGTSSYRAYSRSHELSAPGKPTIAGSSDPVFLGDGQRILAERGNVPTNRTVKEPPPGLAFVDVAKFLDQGDKWTKLFKETFASGMR